MENENVINLKKRVKKLNLKVEYFDHPPTRDYTLIINRLGVNLDECVPTLIFKTDKRYIGIYKLADRKINMTKLKKALGIQDIKMATPDEIKLEFGFTVGAVGIYHPKLKYYIDKQILKKVKVFGGTGTDSEAIVIKPKDLMNLSSAELIDTSEESTVFHPKSVS
jgi:prolyl-tRNA editing enzyme YbaK/EbsC (Cys-tRNA(Pro) deacylase)